jgi:Gpi18-like mannosyltransferase
MEVRDSTLMTSTSKPQSRLIYYIIAFLIRVLISSIFIDQNDGPVFLQTAEDILQNGTSIYFEGSMQNRFNYFPMAYLYILPGMGLYYLFNFDNLVLARVFLRMPINVADLLLAYFLRYYLRNVAQREFSDSQIRNYELLVLFSPVLIYSGAYKGQFDIFVALLLLGSWIFLKQNRVVLSGILSALSILSKPYAIIVSFYVFVYLVKQDKKFSLVYVAGNILGAIPVLGLGAILNLDGMINHAILFHLHRPPDGFSIIGLILDIVTYIPYFSGVNSVALSRPLSIISTAVLVLLLILTSFLLLRSESTSDNLLKAINAGLLFFFLFNKVFWLQYVCLLFVFIMLYLIEQDKNIPITWIDWSLNTIPLVLILRCAFFVPEDIQQFLGENWYNIIWVLGSSLHLFVLGIQLQQKKDLLKTVHQICYYASMLCLWFMNYCYIKINFL